MQVLLRRKVIFATGSFRIFSSIGRFDGDGKPDLALPNGSSRPTFAVIAIRGQQWKYLPQVPVAGKVDFYEQAPFPNSVAIGDFGMAMANPIWALANNG